MRFHPLCRPPFAMAMIAVLIGIRADAKETAVQSIEIASGALAFEAPSAWKVVTPKSRILEKELAVVAPEDAAKPARLTVMAAGGSVHANLARWVGQFKGAEGGADRSGSETEKLDANGMAATVIDISGTYMESAGGPFGPKTPRPGYRMIGAIVETDGAGNYFFKLVGPKEAVDPAADDFRKMIASLHKKP